VLNLDREVSMAKRKKSAELAPDVADGQRRRDQPVPDAPATVPHLGDTPDDTRPAEDGGVAQHPIHDSDIEDLGPEDYEEMTDEIEKSRIKDEP
jgi:hypothetical protein